MKIITATFLAAALMAGTAAYAEDHEGGHKKGKMFEAADTNGDGYLTKAEMRDAQEKRLDKMFEKMDADNDGKVSKDEAKDARNKMRERIRERVQERKENQ